MPQTTIILGAGASADFGMPLGSALYEHALRQLRSFYSEITDIQRNDPFFDLNKCRAWAAQNSFRDCLFNTLTTEKGFDPKRVKSLVALMGSAPAYSIDTLAMENPEHLGLCRAMVAELITAGVRKQIRFDEGEGREVWNFELRSVRAGADVAPNWIHLLASMMRNTLQADPSHQFRFISFNYDRIVEMTLGKIWKLPTRSLGKFDDVVAFTYPHGKISWEVNSSEQSSFKPLQSEIVFAHNKDDLTSFETAISFLDEADVIIALGFHFAPENVRSLSLGRRAMGKRLIYQNYANNRGLDERVGRLGVVDPRKFSGSIADAIVQGELGELPV